MYADEHIILAGADQLMTVRHLRMRGSNFEIGRRLGELAIERHGKSAETFAAVLPYSRARRLYVQHHYPIHWQRMRGVAAALGVSPEDDRYDLTTIMYNMDLPIPPPACSVVYYPPATTASGSGYLSRNYDFTTGRVADLFQIPIPEADRGRIRPAMAEPYLMEWYPEDGGYASLAMQSFDLLSGTLDGINEAGLVVSLMADDEALRELGPGLETHIQVKQVIGLHELQVLRWLLDTCATAEEAMFALLSVKQHYVLVPCHYIVADKTGNSFVYENSTGRNTQHVIEGSDKPQIVTNYQLHRHPAPARVAGDEVSLETEAFWRQQTLADRIASHPGPFTEDAIIANNACVNVQQVIVAAGAGLAKLPMAASTRTLWHSLYDQHRTTVDVSFYLGETLAPDGTNVEHRSEYRRFALDTSRRQAATALHHRG